MKYAVNRKSIAITVSDKVSFFFFKWDGSKVICKSSDAALSPRDETCIILPNDNSMYEII